MYVAAVAAPPFCFIKVLTIGISRNELPIFIIVSATLVGFGVYRQVSHPRAIIQWIEIWRLKYQRVYFKVTFAVLLLVHFEKCTFKFK